MKNDDDSKVKNKIKSLEDKIKKTKRERKKTHRSKFGIYENEHLELNTVHDQTISEPTKEKPNIEVEKPITADDSEILKNCWICLTEDFGEFLKPCKCRGSTKFVHRQCFLDFLQTKTSEKLVCSFCKAPYILKYKNEKFIKFYDKLKKFNYYFSNFMFMAIAFSTIYAIFFIYGASVVFYFVGCDDFFDYALQDSFGSFPFRFLNIVRLAINIPMVPICLLLTAHRKFSCFFHCLPTYILDNDLNLKYVLIYLTPMIYYVYYRFIFYLEKKFGKKSDEASIMVNNHHFEMKVVVNTLITPYIGISFGYCFNMFEKRYVRSAVGCIFYVLIRDFLGIYYLFSLKKRIKTMVIGEYVNGELIVNDNK
ncbi:E3 ubiquitin-protein ligase march5 [Gurleya vavrai]